MSERSLTVGGLPGTGTTTLCRLLEERLALPYTYAGAIFRAEAERRGLDLAAFGRLCQDDPSVDRALDDRQVELLRTGGILLEGRLSGWLAHQNALPACKVWLTCRDDERFRRLAERDGEDPEMQGAKAREREASEADRYRRYYGIDLSDVSIYDLVIDGTEMTPDAIADKVEEAWHAGA